MPIDRKRMRPARRIKQEQREIACRRRRAARTGRRPTPTMPPSAKNHGAECICSQNPACGKEFNVAEAEHLAPAPFAVDKGEETTPCASNVARNRQRHINIAAARQDVQKPEQGQQQIMPVGNNAEMQIDKAQSRAAGQCRGITALRPTTNPANTCRDAERRKPSFRRPVAATNPCASRTGS